MIQSSESQPAINDCWNQAERDAAAKKAATVLDGKHNNVDLLEKLGYTVMQNDRDRRTKLLCSGSQHLALAILLQESESPEAGLTDLCGLSPISYALAKADEKNLPWVMTVKETQLRLYSTNIHAGVGRRGRSETFIEVQPSLLSNRVYSIFWLLFSAEALLPRGSLERIIDNSKRFAGGLAGQLRGRIYHEVVPNLAMGIVEARSLKNPSREELDTSYEMALQVLFRLLFIAYAEDRDLLPYRSNELYRKRSLKEKAKDLAKLVENGTAVSAGNDHWKETMLLCEAVKQGHVQWNVPEYNGDLFSSDESESAIGAKLSKICLDNTAFETALRTLLVVKTEENVFGPVDFRSLGVREFGTIYEALLESELGYAEVNLSLSSDNDYIHSTDGSPIAVKAGSVYLHNRSGKRKSSGSYYTKHFAVEHLLDKALEPALVKHFERIDSLENDVDASEKFFDFRVADIAMGSGHFLVAAIDRIERGMTYYLANRPLNGVRGELSQLRKVANENYHTSAEFINIEDGPLLRRMIAKRCIRGVDINHLAVQLARLSVWIHTFVPGLPLSQLDYNLVHGNSLVGVGTIDEVRRKFLDAGHIFDVDVNEIITNVQEPLRELARLKDIEVQDFKAEELVRNRIHRELVDVKALCDLISAGPISKSPEIKGFLFEDWEKRKYHAKTHELAELARSELDEVNAVHFPIIFPEVFFRNRPGFDVIVGNPPWQEVTVEEHAFWARYSPGLRGKEQFEQEIQKEHLRNTRPELHRLYLQEVKEMALTRKSLVSGPYPGIGTGDPDLYKAFCWRFWDLLSSDCGGIGVVLPRSVLFAKGSSLFRKKIFSDSAIVDIVTLKNVKGWVFPDVTSQYTICLLCLLRGEPQDCNIHIRGPFSSAEEYDSGKTDEPITFGVLDVQKLSEHYTLPLIPSNSSAEIFKKMRQQPRLYPPPPPPIHGWRDRTGSSTRQIKNI